jgi:glycerol-3-phosphate cytidylyltransferase
MKVGFTCGSFDLLHAGHIMMLEEAKSYCDYLIVAIQSDPTLDRGSKNKPVQSYEERIIMLKAIRYVDEITYYDTENDLYELLKRIKPDVRIIGSDWQGKQYTGYDLDIPVIFNSRNHGYSSSELRRRVYEAELKKITKY